MNFEHVTLIMTFDLLLKNFIFSHNLCSLWQGLSNGNINFEYVTLTLTFDLILNIGHNFLTVTDVHVHTYPMVP